ncbi:MAG: metal ABC transporter substrate-binding protein [Chloroflexota bacterium]|nr:metal ABC transporter substrate-binding protein [Chloroflexota bacterium]PLS77873.1 MAG: hypothetical protein CYG59_21515 [Chloroflexota bacterium]
MRHVKRLAQRSVFRRVVLLCVCTLPWLVGCAQPSAELPPLKVVATIAPLADWARQVGQARVTVTQIVPIGVNPRDYKLGERDQRALAEADILLYNGLDLEPWLRAAIPDAQAQQLVILELSRFIGNMQVGGNGRLPFAERGGNSQQGGDEPGNVDVARWSPYLWLDPGPGMAQHAVSLIADTFTRVDSDHLLVYRRNAEKYNGELENLDSWVRREIRGWPRTRIGTSDTLVIQTLDYGWFYFAQRYGINLRMIDPELAGTKAPINAAPLFVDQFVRPVEYMELLSLRQPDGVLKPLGQDNYLQLMRDNVNTISQGMRRVAHAHPTRTQLPYETR